MENDATARHAVGPSARDAEITDSPVRGRPTNQTALPATLQPSVLPDQPVLKTPHQPNRLHTPHDPDRPDTRVPYRAHDSKHLHNTSDNTTNLCKTWQSLEIDTSRVLPVLDG
ncbi:hypothetical protein Cme02nite_65460 [Catellatospora methionotrophica]|uniref:Uncharacterized protein n=1 Tax=Catellatospora methionotrophica TaxID=121620 RepID=A0A8J3PIX7_9ACTN|nr:hypothetical protein Cme02nite_65460 [Catellatospora methionotrophica]